MFAMVLFQEKYTNGLYYRVYGSGEPLVLIHGFLGSGRDFDSITEKLAGQFRLLIPDLPGCGKSKTYETTGSYGMQTMVDAICYMLGSEGVLRCNVAGYSMGGRVALTLACEDRSPVDRLILLSAGPGISDVGEREARLDLDTERAHILQREGLYSFVEQWYRAPVFESFVQSDYFEEVFSWRLLENDAAFSARIIVDMSPGAVPAEWDRLAHFKKPLLYMYGATDEKYAGLAKEIARVAPQAVLHEVSTSGHVLPLEAADTVSRVIESFLRAG